MKMYKKLFRANVLYITSSIVNCIQFLLNIQIDFICMLIIIWIVFIPIDIILEKFLLKEYDKYENLDIVGLLSLFIFVGISLFFVVKVYDFS